MLLSLTKAQDVQSLASQQLHGFYLGVERVALGQAVLRVLRSSPNQYPSTTGPSKSEYYLERKDKRAKPGTFKQQRFFLYRRPPDEKVRKGADKYCLHCDIFMYIRHIWIKPVLCSRMVSLLHHTSP